MSVTRPGLPLFTFQPSLLSAENPAGWYDLEMMSEIVANMGIDQPGYATQARESPVEEGFGASSSLTQQVYVRGGAAYSPQNG